VTGGSDVRRVSRDALLQMRERAWRPRLRGVSLVAEAEIREEHRTQAASALGVLYGRRRYPDADGYDFLLRWPACLVAAMTGVAVTKYAQGTYWPALWEAAEYKGSPADQRVWGQAFGTALAQLGLPSFPDTKQLRYIGPILMHAGIPAYCLGDFFRLLAERRRHDPCLDADAFLAWAAAPGRSLRLSQLDVPARRFLLNGGEYAAACPARPATPSGNRPPSAGPGRGSPAPIRGSGSSARTGGPLPPRSRAPQAPSSR
jgi:hypothetical protein